MNRLEEALSGASRAYRKAVRLKHGFDSNRAKLDLITRNSPEMDKASDDIRRKASNLRSVVPKKFKRVKDRAQRRVFQKGLIKNHERLKAGKYKKYESKDMGKLLQNLVEGSLGSRRSIRLYKASNKLYKQASDSKDFDLDKSAKSLKLLKKAGKRNKKQLIKLKTKRREREAHNVKLRSHPGMRIGADPSPKP